MTDPKDPQAPKTPPEAPAPAHPKRDPRLEIPEVLRDKPADPRTQHVTTRRESFGDTARAWGMALDLVFTTIGGLIVGWLIDWWLGTGPWGAIIGLALGFVLAAIRLVRGTMKAEKKEQAERDARRRAAHPDNPPDSRA